jgi:hypothetical protein
MLYFEDIQPGEVLRSSAYTVEADETITVMSHLDTLIVRRRTEGEPSEARRRRTVRSRLLARSPVAPIPRCPASLTRRSRRRCRRLLPVSQLGELDDSNVLRFLALSSGGDVELDALSLVEALVALPDDVGEVDEHIVALLT